MFNKEPTVIVGALAEVVRQIIPLLIIFGLIHWTGEQVAQVGLVIGVIVGFLNVLLTRSQVTPDERVDDLIKTAIKLPANATVGQVKAEQAAKED